MRILLLLCVLVLGGCEDRDLRGSGSPSPDGGTYLVVVDDNGGGCGQLFVDNTPWPYKVGEKGPIAPGRHIIRCGPEGDLPFDVEAGTTYRFDYWGP